MAARRPRFPSLRIPSVPGCVLLLSLAVQPRLTSGIQVTPNSPCSSICIDSSDLDVSDPNSSNTLKADLSCQDSDFTSSTVGQKWTSCLSCLQNSTFSQGSENDQGWFFYNLRYNFDYCIFGYPNGSDTGTNPCQTTTACGQLLNALEDGIPGMGNHSEFDYCSVDSSTMTGSAYSQCLSCVSALDSGVTVSNALVALEAGCIQKPSGELVVGLSDSVFATTVISITSASSTASSTSSRSRGSHIRTTTAAAIAIVAVVIVAAISAVTFVLYRKRRAQRRRSGGFGNGSQGIKIDSLGLGGCDIGSPIPGGTFSGGLNRMSYLQPMSMASTMMQNESTLEKRMGRPGLASESPLHVGMQFAPASESRRDMSESQLLPLSPSPYTVTSDLACPPASHPQARLPELPQLTTLLPRTSRKEPLPTSAAAAASLQHLSPMSPPSAFTHTPSSQGGYYGGGNRISPTMYDSPVFSTPTSATALLPAATAAFPDASMSPTAQLRQQQAQALFAPYMPAAYRPNAEDGGGYSGFGGLGIVSGSMPSQPSTDLPPRPLHNSGFHGATSPDSMGHLERMDLELVQQANVPGRKKAKKGGSPESTQSIKVDFPGPPGRR
ncbi:hypothetical protein CMQ_318 [Grosmannia clavigera kw1407]|uniref:Lpxtg-domain-containing protein n=1 Tax=Grosmannia clavigera (strain kw1407 / UAMH 11150) TaxID=655863 RepID=F0XRB0_GROCL|nr:uncharacterized protein CMQ_318 [Grosmannia clavigera kw1407]EFX00001.1 hypothetical protein CMQ_318 [Grosmannia clavigera kw1407]